MKKLQKLNLKTKELSVREMKNVKGGGQTCTIYYCSGGSDSFYCSNSIDECLWAMEHMSDWCGGGCFGPEGY